MNDIALIAQPHPFRAERVRCEVSAGQTLAQMLGPAASHSLSVCIGGREVPSALWSCVKPKAGQQINVRVFPQGGDSNKWIRAIAMIVLTVVTYGIATGAIWGGVSVFGLSGAALAGAVGVIGSLAISPLIGSALEVSP